MENGVEALKLAAGILIFVLAITIAISSFTSASQASKRIFAMQEKNQYVKDADGNFINFVQFENGTRTVTVETIIPAIYRAYKENYAIYFYESDGQTPFVLYEKTKGGKTVEINYIDLEKEVYTSPEAAIANMNKLLYEDGLYDKLKDKTFIEKLGEYYMDDLWGGSETAEVNKTKKRVIVYQLAN